MWELKKNYPREIKIKNKKARKIKIKIKINEKRGAQNVE